MVARSLMGARGSSGGPSSVARTFVGVDVSKSFVDIADTAGRKTRVGNNVAALIGVFTGPWSREACANMVCEATGGYARALMHVAGALGLPLRKIHPNRARAFAKARRRLAKTDAIDAETLAAFAAVTAGEEPLPQKSSQQQELAGQPSRPAERPAPERKLPGKASRRQIGQGVPENHARLASHKLSLFGKTPMQPHPLMQLSITAAAVTVAASAITFTVWTWREHRNADLVRIGISVLRVDPEKEKQISAARKWALNLIDANAGGVTLSQEAKEQLLREPLKFSTYFGGGDTKFVSDFGGWDTKPDNPAAHRPAPEPPK